MQNVLQTAWNLYNYYLTSTEELLALNTTQKQLRILFDTQEPTITISFKLKDNMSNVQEKEKPILSNMYGSSSSSSTGNIRSELVANESNGGEFNVEVKLKGLIILALGFKKSYAFGNKLEPFTIYDVLTYMRELISPSDPIMQAQLINPDLIKIEDILLSLPEIVVNDNTRDGGVKCFLWLPEDDSLKKGINDHIKKIHLNRMVITLKEWSSNMRTTVNLGGVEVKIVDFQPMDFCLIQENYDSATSTNVFNGVQNTANLTIFNGRGTITKGFLVGLSKHTHILTIYNVLVKRGYNISIKIETPDNPYQPLIDLDSKTLRDVCKGGGIDHCYVVSPFHSKFLKGCMYYDITPNKYSSSSPTTI